MGEGNGNSTALARPEEVRPQVSPFGGDRESWNTTQRIALALASSSIVPAAYRGDAGMPNVLVAMEYANRLGASVLAVMQNLDVIHGRPSLRASFLIGTVNACGRFSPIRFRWEGDKGKDTWGCRAVAKDRETGEECVGPLITIALAKAEGWVEKSGSKWKTIPELMLMYRSGAWWSRVYCPELSLGLHTTDELEDIGYAAPGQRAAVVAAALDAGDGPEGTTTLPPAASEPEADTSPATPEQIKQLQNLLPKAREAELIGADDEEGMAGAIKRKDGQLVREWIRDIQARLARGQTSLGVEA